MRFRPLLWPTLTVVPMLIVLLGLGTWQLERREWKLGLVAEMQARLGAPELRLEDLPQGEILEYRHVSAMGRFDHAHEVFWLTSDLEGVTGYHVLTPLLREGAPTLLVDRGFVPPDRKDPASRAAAQYEGEVTVHGVVRGSQAPNFVTPADDMAKGLIYTRDVGRIAGELKLGPVLPFFLEADATPNPSGYPLGGQTTVALRNEHLSYAITWYGLAAALLIVYLVYHRSRGRLG